MNIVDGLSGRELMTLENVIKSLGLSGVLFVCLSPLVIGFIVTISVRYIRKKNKYKKQQKETKEKQKETEKQQSNEKIKQNISVMHTKEIKKAEKAQSLTLSFNKDGSVKEGIKNEQRSNSKT